MFGWNVQAPLVGAVLEKAGYSLDTVEGVADGCAGQSKKSGEPDGQRLDDAPRKEMLYSVCTDEG